MNNATRKLLNLPPADDPRYQPNPSTAQTEEQPAPEIDISRIIRQETDDGRLVVRFLISAMTGELDHFKACHQLDAARQLIKFGFDDARSFIDQFAIAPNSNLNSHSRHAQEPEHRIHPDLARIIHDETDNGKTAVQFLINVMQGKLPDFKPHHRINAAKELLRLAFPTEQNSQTENKAQQAEQEEKHRKSEYADKMLQLPPEKRDLFAFDHNSHCDHYSGLTSCFGAALNHIEDAEGIRGVAERKAFDKAYPNYSAPTEAETRRIVEEYAFNGNDNAPILSAIPLPNIKNYARQLFNQDRHESQPEPLPP